MGAIQSAINRTIGSISGATYGIKNQLLLKERQEQAIARAKEIAEAKKKQRRSFKDYLAKTNPIFTQLGEQAQKNVLSQFNPAQRKKLMDAADKEAKRGSIKK